MKLFKICKKIKKYGVKKSLEIFSRNFFGIFYLYEINLKYFNKKKSEGSSYKLKKIDNNIMNKIIMEKKFLPYKIKAIEDRIKNYSEVLSYVAIDKENNIMGHFFIALKNSYPYFHKNLIIEEGTTYYFDDFTLEEYRKKGVQLFSLLRRMEISKQLGYKKSTILVYNFNINAQKAIEKSGMKKVQKIYELKLFKKKFLIYGRKYKNGNM